jgi:hypothetical protein
MGRPPFRVPSDERAWLEPFSGGRRGPPASGGFTRAQIEQIARTVRRTREVMVKVTGGGSNVGAVAAHLAYIGRKGALEIETDEGQRVTGREAQKAILDDWHLELSAGQYRRPGTGQARARATKLVYNLVLSMPSPVSPDSVLAAARKFSREKFGAQHRYAMVLHTDQAHPHVHVVVKAENEEGRRLHIDKPMLRQWREDFAQAMREQGVAANATPRSVRGRNPGKVKDAVYRARRRGDQRQAVTFAAPVNDQNRETRALVTSYWKDTARRLDQQGEIELAGDVRYFANRLPGSPAEKERPRVLVMDRSR